MRYLDVHLDKILSNYRAFEALVGPRVFVAGAVKADAYGFGMEAVASVLGLGGCRHFFVAAFEEGVKLREIFSLYGLEGCSIFILDGFVDAAAAPSCRDFERWRLIPVLNTEESVARFAAYAAQSVADVAIMCDTGMNRLGVSASFLESLKAQSYPSLRLSHILSHLSCAADPSSAMNKSQWEKARRLKALFPHVPFSLGATNGAQIGREYHFDAIRLGGGLFGSRSPSMPLALDLEGTAEVKGRLLQVRYVRRGESVGYDAAFTAQTEETVGIVACGYADGILRRYGPALRILWDGRRLDVLGLISMDMLAVRLSGTDPQSWQLGREVTLLARGDELEGPLWEASDRNPRQLWAGFGRRLERRWFWKNKNIILESLKDIVLPKKGVSV